MNCTLKRGILNMPPDEKVEPRWPRVRDMIPNHLRDCFKQGKVWEFREPREIITGVKYETV